MKLERAFRRARYSTPGLGAGQEMRVPADSEPLDEQHGPFVTVNEPLTPAQLADAFGEDALSPDELAALAREGWVA